MIEINHLSGAWLTQDMSIVRNGTQLGSWPEIGTWIFCPTSGTSGYFCFTVQYMGDDPNYPVDMLKFLASSGTYTLEGNRLTTQTQSSSAFKRIGQFQHYEIALNGDLLEISASMGENSKFTTVHRRAKA